jgi:hypothetical protein
MGTSPASGIGQATPLGGFRHILGLVGIAPLPIDRIIDTAFLDAGLHFFKSEMGVSVLFWEVLTNGIAERCLFLALEAELALDPDAFDVEDLWLSDALDVVLAADLAGEWVVLTDFQAALLVDFPFAVVLCAVNSWCKSDFIFDPRPDGVASGVLTDDPSPLFDSCPDGVISGFFDNDRSPLFDPRPDGVACVLADGRCPLLVAGLS